MAWPAIIAGAAALGSSYLAGRSRRKSAQRTRRANLELAKYQYQKDTEFWKKQNEYNSPKNQMKRFQEAGLNKNLIYGQGTPGNAQQLVKYSRPEQPYDEAPFMDPSMAVSKFQNFKSQEQNIKLAQANTNVQKTMDVLKMAQADGIFQQNTIRSLNATIVDYLMKNELTGEDLSQIGNAKIGGMKAEQWLKIATSQIKQWEKSLTDNNINPRDSTTIRMVIDVLDMLGFSPEKLKRKYNVK